MTAECLRTAVVNQLHAWLNEDLVYENKKYKKQNKEPKVKIEV